MKLKRTILLGLALIMVLSIALPAMAVKQEEKLQWLIDQKIVAGRNNNGVIEMDYDQNLKRSEFAKIVILSGGFKESDAEALKGYASFPDVPEGHWARGYINLSRSKGMVIGFDDGNFYPENFVTFAQVCAMLVRMDSRWASEKTSSVTWPQGFIDLAKKYDILKDVTPVGSNDFVRRDMAFEMLYNHLQTKDSANTYTVKFDYDATLGIHGYKKGDRDNDYPEVYKKDFSITEAKVKKNEKIKANQIPMGISVKEYPLDGGNTITTWYLQGWFTKPGGKGDQLKADTKITGDITYYAYWSKEKALGYADNFRVTQPNDITAPVGTTFGNLGLPGTVYVTFDRNSGIDERQNGEYRITWRSSDYDPKAEGDQVILGDLDSRSMPDKASYVNPVASIKVVRTGKEVDITFKSLDTNESQVIKTTNNSLTIPKTFTNLRTSYTNPDTGKTYTITRWVDAKNNFYYSDRSYPFTEATTLTAVWAENTTPTVEKATITVKQLNGEFIWSKTVNVGTHLSNLQSDLSAKLANVGLEDYTLPDETLKKDKEITVPLNLKTYTITFIIKTDNYKFADTNATGDGHILTKTYQHNDKVTAPAIVTSSGDAIPGGKKITWKPTIVSTPKDNATYYATIDNKPTE